MTFASLLKDWQVLAALMLLGFVVREVCKPIQKLYIPTSMLAGFLGLILGPQVLGVITVPKSFSSYAGALIGLVLTCIVLGITFDRSRFRNYVDYACVCIAVWGMQLMVGAPLGEVLSKFWPSLPKGWGLLGVFSFWGGHGTAGAAGTALDKLGAEGALSMGMILSTVGLMSAVTIGMVIVNWGIRKGYAQYTKIPESGYDPTLSGVLPKELQRPIGHVKVSTNGINALVLQICLILFSMWLGQLILGTLGNTIFPWVKKLGSLVNGMLGAAIIRIIMSKMHWDGYLDKPTVSQVSGCALDVLILGAVSTMKLSLVSTFIVPIVVYSAVLLALTIAVSLFFCRKYCKLEWFEKACCLFGMASGAVPTGLALVRAVDPDGKSSAPDAQGVASSAWAPVYGSMPAILPALYFGGNLAACVGIGAASFFIPLVIGWVMFANKK